MQQTRLQCGSIKTIRERERERERERDPDIITSTKHRARDCLALHVSNEKRKGGVLLVTVMIEIVKWISK